MKTCNENLVEDEHYLLHASICNVIDEKHDDLLYGGDNLSVILKSPPKRVSTYLLCIIFIIILKSSTSNPPC